MEHQITLWELLKANERDINKLSEQEAIDIINRECGVNLAYSSKTEDFKAKLKHGYILSVSYSNYFADDDFEENYYNGIATGPLFIGVDIMSSHGGCSSPIDTLDEAIEMINKHIKEWRLL